MKSLIALAACGALLALAGATLLEPDDAARAQTQTEFARFAKVEKWVGTFTLESKWDKEQKLINDEIRRGHLSWRATVHFKLNFSESVGNAAYQWIGEQCRATASVDESGLIEGRYGERSYTTLKGEQTKDCDVPPALDIFPENGTYTFMFPLISIDAKHSEFGTQPATLVGKETAYTGPLLSGSDLVLSGSLDTHPNVVVVPDVFGGGFLGRQTKDMVPLHLSWTLSPAGQVDAEAVIIPPKDYPNWQPQAGDDEKTAGNSLVVTAKIYKKGHPQEPSRQKAQFKFELVDVSKEKGVCLNWPAVDATDDFDLQIDPLANLELTIGDEKRQNAISEKGLDESKVKITSYDWGAWGKLKVTAVFLDGTEVPAHLEGNKAKNELVIPKDDNGNHIADAWEEPFHLAGGSNAKDDRDSIPPGPPGDDGDGLSLYEEYRGFRVQGKHIFTYPALKDIFIVDGIGSGLGYFGESELTTHLIDYDEYGLEIGDTNGRVINPNRGFATLGPQHVLMLQNKHMPGLFGMAEGRGPGPPKTTQSVAIDVAACNKVGPTQLPHTIAHELAHGCNVWHHGDSNYKITQYRWLQADGTWGAWQAAPDDVKYDVCVTGGQESGVQECIMRYSGGGMLVRAAANMQWIRPDGLIERGALYGPPEAPGTIFCDQNEGTGVNAPPNSKAGNATEGKGKCKRQFCVNDRKH